ncbi:MAG TPA: acylphosphatase [Candidatus Limnocylindrales bacterium]|nr:acylphosphatase [Candidatus Limnocylindrales bacterium]
MSSDEVPGQERLTATVRGRVQGVGFRWFVRTRAESLGLRGWTANQSDGSVIIVAEGPTQVLHELLAVLERGPSGASVHGVDADRTSATGEFKGFKIRHGAHRGD